MPYDPPAAFDARRERIAELNDAFRRDPIARGRLMLTAGVDVQHNRLEAYVWGWGRDLESWLIDRQVIFGSPALTETWTALENLLAQAEEVGRVVGGLRASIRNVTVSTPSARVSASPTQDLGLSTQH